MSRRLKEVVVLTRMVIYLSISDVLGLSPFGLTISPKPLYVSDPLADNRFTYLVSNAANPKRLSYLRLPEMV